MGKGIAVRFIFIATYRLVWPVRVMCDVLDVSVSGFWASACRAPSARSMRDAMLSEQISESHVQSRGVYGMLRILADLREAGHAVGPRTVTRLMRQLDITGEAGRTPRVQTTVADPTHPKARNVLNRDFTADRPNQRWVTDITVIDTDEGRLYLAAIEDLFSRKVVGWAIDTHMETSLVLRALDSAITTRKPEPGLVHHSDRGCQFTSAAYRQELTDSSMIASMSRTGNCHDNACAESFWARLKVECVYRTRFATRREAEEAIFSYIEVFYNRTRRHSTLGYLCPDAFEARYHANAA